MARSANSGEANGRWKNGHHLHNKVDALSLLNNKQPLTIIVMATKKGGIIEWRNEEKTIANICRHLRNSIAHCHFKAYSSDGTRIIDRIVFNDYVKEEVKDEQSFQYDTKVTDFRFFFRETRG